MGGPDLASPDTQMGSENLSFLYTDGSQTFGSYYQNLNYVNVNISRLLKDTRVDSFREPVFVDDGCQYLDIKWK